MKHNLELRLLRLLARLRVMKTATTFAWALVVALCAQPVCAATRTVTNLNDSGPGSLRDTIAIASPGDTIIFSVTGVITLTSGELVMGKDLRINGPGAASLQVGGNYISRVFRVPVGVVATISDVTIGPGWAVGPDGAAGAPNQPGQAGTPGRGGGIYNAGSLTLSRCFFYGNLATGGRGGKGGQNGNDSGNPGGILLLAGPGGDGGVGEGAGVYSEGSLSVSNCSFFENLCVGGAGGQGADGTHHGVGGSSSPSGAKGGGGGSTRGGAICHLGSLTIVNSTFTQNSALAGAGGAGGQGADFFDGAPGGGGGNGGDGSGGAIWVHSVMAVNCTIAENSVSNGAGGNGGAPVCGYNPCVPGAAGITGQSLAGGLSQATAGGAILNTIIALNSAGGLVEDVSGTVTSLGHDLIGRTSGSSGWLASDLQDPSPFDIQLGPLEYNSGPVPTMALLPASIAIDAGDDAVLSPPYSLSTDARGFVRRTSDHVDIGAYEFSTITRLVTTTSDSGGGSLRNAIGLASPLDRILFARIVRGTIRLTSGELLINKPLSIVGPGAPVLAISGNTNSRVFHIGPQGDVEIHGLTITEGRVVEANGIDAVAYTSATPGGYARGGGVFNEGMLRMFDSMIVSNSVQGGRGGSGNSEIFGGDWNGETGGPAVGAGVFSAGLLDLHRCTLTGNRAVGGAGGAGGSATSLAFPIAPGTAGYASGAGAYAASASLESCTVAANQSTGGQGGRGVQYLLPPSEGPGGPGGPAAGGGLSGGLALTNCSVSGNSVTGGMGGIGSTDGAIGATYAGGVNVVQLSVQSTVIAGNTGSATSTDVLGTVTSQGWNLIGITDGSSGWTTDDFLGNSSFPLDARLSACQDNGGPVWTMCPLAGSPARDAGLSDLATDARGGRRVADFPNVPNAPGGDGSDIGALEVDSLFGAITITKSNTFARVRFKSDPGTTYRLQQTSVVGNPVWTNVVGATITGNGQNLEAGDPGPLPPVRFYRVRAD